MKIRFILNVKKLFLINHHLFHNDQHNHSSFHISLNFLLRSCIFKIIKWCNAWFSFNYMFVYTILKSWFSCLIFPTPYSFNALSGAFLKYFGVSFGIILFLIHSWNVFKCLWFGFCWFLLCFCLFFYLAFFYLCPLILFFIYCDY